jgi:hypothetical protein
MSENVDPRWPKTAAEWHDYIRMFADMGQPVELLLAQRELCRLYGEQQ